MVEEVGAAGVVMVEVDETVVAKSEISGEVVAGPASRAARPTARTDYPVAHRPTVPHGLGTASEGIDPAVTDALYVAEGDRFVPTELTRGGWTEDTQHGGPPAGLLGRSIELVPTAVPMQIVRCTIDLFRPIPLRPLSV